MKDSLILEIISKKELLKQKIENLKKFEIDLENIWIEKEIKEIKSNNILAIDGSFNFLKFRAFTLYAILISCVFLKEKIEVKNYSYVDVVPNFFGFDEFVKIKMIKSELENALENLDKFNLILLDGSLIGFYSLKPSFEIEEILKLFKEKNEIIEKFKDKNVISIVKTSTQKGLSNIPDVILFEKVKEGYSVLFEEKINNLKFYYFYFKFSNSQVFKIETLKKFDVEELLGIIKNISIDGYPYLLKVAHQNALIKNSDMEQIAKILEIYEKSGREIL